MHMNDTELASLTDEELRHALEKAESEANEASGRASRLFLASRRTADDYRLTKSMIGRRCYYVDMSNPLAPTVVEGVIELGYYSWEDDCYPDILFTEQKVYMDVESVYVSQEGVERDLEMLLDALRDATATVLSQLDSMRNERLR